MAKSPFRYIVPMVSALSDGRRSGICEVVLRSGIEDTPDRSRQTATNNLGYFPPQVVPVLLPRPSPLYEQHRFEEVRSSTISIMP
jgi:hypothetical protein